MSLFGGLFGVTGRAGAALTRTGSGAFAAGAGGIALGGLLASGYTVFTKAAGSAKLAVSAGGALSTNAATSAAEVLTARFRAATADGSRAIEETFTFTASGAAPTGGTLDFSDPANSGLVAAL